MAIKKKKRQKAIGGHLYAKGPDGLPLYANDAARQSFIDSIKNKSIDIDLLIDIAKDPDRDTFYLKDDAFPFDAREWKDTDGDGIGDNEDIIFTKARLDDILWVNGVYYGKEWSIEILPESKRRQVDGVFQVLDPSTPEDVGPIKTYAIVRPVEADDEEERLRLHPFQPELYERHYLRMENPGRFGSFGQWTVSIIQTKAVLDEIMTLPTPADRFTALTAARNSEYVIPTALEARASTVNGQVADGHWFNMDYLCLIKNWNEYYEAGYLVTHPLTYKYSGYSNITLDEIKRLKAELLSMSPDTSGTVSFENANINFSNLILTPEDEPERYVNQFLNDDGKKWMGNSDYTEWLDAYLLEGGAKFIVETVMTTDYETIFNEAVSLLNDTTTILKALDQEAKDEGFIAETPRSFTIDEWVSFGYSREAFEDIDC